MTALLALLLALAAPAGPTTCRYECICFRGEGYRCQRYYTEVCDRGACWQCQDAITVRARLSCSLGGPARDCFCKSSTARPRAVPTASYLGRCASMARRRVLSDTTPRQTLRILPRGSTSTVVGISRTL